MTDLKCLTRCYEASVSCREPEQNKLEKARQLKIYRLLDQEQVISEQFSKETLKRLEREKVGPQHS